MLLLLNDIVKIYIFDCTVIKISMIDEEACYVVKLWRCFTSYMKHESFDTQD